MATKKERRVSVRLDGATWKWVQQTMAGNDRDASWVIRSCIKDAMAIDRGEFVSAEAARKAGGA